MVCCLSGKVTTTAQFETTGESMEWIGLVVFIGVIAYIVLLAGRNKRKGASTACRSWYFPRSARKTVIAKPALVLAVSVLFTFTPVSSWADWRADALADTLKEASKSLDEEIKLRRQKELLDYQYKLESERIERTYQIQRERVERERVEQDRRQETARRQQKIAEDKKLQEAAETKRNAISTGTGFLSRQEAI